MARPNAALESVLDRFAGQGGIPSQYAAQLRSALSQDSELLQRLNEDAANGRLRGLAASAPGDRKNLAGTFELSSGVATLPALSFKSQGTTASQDLIATLRLQDMAARFGHGAYKDASGNQVAVAQDIITNIQSAINDSPWIAKHIKQAAMPSGAGEKALLREYGSHQGSVAGGSYDGSTGALNFMTGRLAAPLTNAGKVELTFVIGHEIQHALNHPEKLRASGAFESALLAIAKDRNPINDYSRPVSELIHASRIDEAQATISGWNAVLSHVQQAHPNAGLKEMMDTRSDRMLDFIRTDPISRQDVARPGIVLNSDNSISHTPENIEALGRYYFDQPPRGTPDVPVHDTMDIGYHGDSDYANSVGAYAVSRAIHYEQNHARSVRGVEPQMHLDMAGLRFNETLLERNGIKLSRNPDQAQPYFDSSQNPPAPGRFHHTDTEGQARSHRYVPVQSIEHADLQAPVTRSARLTPADRGHPDHAAYDRIHQAICQHGRWNEAQSRNIAASALAAFKADPLSTRLDGGAIVDAPGGPTAFTVCSPWGDKGPHFHTQTDAQPAAQAHAERSFEQAERLNPQPPPATPDEPAHARPKLH